MNTLGGDAAKLTVSRIVTLLISMGTAMLLSRFRTLEEYGTYSQILLVTNVVTTLFMFGLPNSINYFLARADSPEERRRFLSVYYTLSAMLSMVTGLSLVLTVPLLEAYFDNRALSSFAYVLAIYPWARIVMASIDGVLIIYGRTTALVGFRVVNSVALLGAVVLVQAFELGFGAYMALFTLVEAISALATYAVVMRLSGGIRPRFDFPLLRAVLTFSIPLGLAASVGSLTIELDKLIIGYVLDTTQLAIYTNAAREIPVTIIASSFTAVLLPRLARLLAEGKYHHGLAIWADATVLSFAIISFVAAGMFTFAPEVLSLLYSEKYAPGAPVFRVYCVVLLLRTTYFGIVLNATGNTRAVFYASVLALAINVPLSLLLYQLIGLIGPAIGTLVSIGAVQFSQLVLTARRMGVTLREVFPWSALLGILMTNMALGIMFSLMARHLSIEIWLGSIGEALLLGTVWGGVYLALIQRRLRTRWRSLNAGAED